MRLSTFNRNVAGYAIIPTVLTRNEMELVCAEINCGSLRRTRAGARHLLSNETVRNLAFDPRLIDVVQSVLGPEALPFRATLFDKSSVSNWLVVWHQDTALPLRERRDLIGWGPWSVKEGVVYAHAPARALERLLSLRVHLDDSTENNGPLRVLPGTHTRGVLTDSDIERLSSEIRPVNCVVNSGGVVAMRPLIVHASSKSTSDMPRRVLHIEYASQFEVEKDLQLAIA